MTPIIKKTLEFSNMNDSNLFFIYLPEYERYTDNYKGGDIMRNKVLSIVNDLNIPIIDIHEDLFKNEKDKLKFFPLRQNGHYNELGYKRVARIVYNKILNNEY